MSNNSSYFNDSLARNTQGVFSHSGGDTGGESMTFKVLKLSLYALIFLISTVGNSLVCIVIARRRRMRTVTNYFILNLAIADLAITLICIPFDIPVQENGYKWPYGAFMCKIMYPLQTMCMFASIFTLVAVSLNRFWAIVYPLRQEMSKSQATIIIILIWFISSGLTVPYVTVLELKNGDDCSESWPEPGYRKAYTACIFVVQYLLPLTLIAFAYLKIGFELRKCVGTRTANSALERAKQEDTRKVVRMLIIVTLLFAMCVLPNNVMWLWLDFGNGNDYEHIWEMVAVTNIILFANSATNPVAYTICNERFREEFRLYFTCDPKIFHTMQTTIFKSFREESEDCSQAPKLFKNSEEVLLVTAKETVV
ncbi:predicted protein [Nematostella vectensis]|uniref:G-protein coupled receptors family 1 profile domain-containing protein n=2 Tax=Nematostella vectensis TaxID=45351 RepID=A7RR06_NEMVE|nr:predicted protein [Nematostella vectensis]|eukprot:XP_001638147.1 predicted protein [Nematostella vectensis]